MRLEIQKLQYIHHHTALPFLARLQMKSSSQQPSNQTTTHRSHIQPTVHPSLPLHPLTKPSLCIKLQTSGPRQPTRATATSQQFLEPLDHCSAYVTSATQECRVRDPIPGPANRLPIQSLPLMRPLHQRNQVVTSRPTSRCIKTAERQPAAVCAYKHSRACVRARTPVCACANARVSANARACVRASTLISPPPNQFQLVNVCLGKSVQNTPANYCRPELNVEPCYNLFARQVLYHGAGSDATFAILVLPSTICHALMCFRLFAVRAGFVNSAAILIEPGSPTI